MRAGDGGVMPSLMEVSRNKGGVLEASRGEGWVIAVSEMEE